MNFPCCDERPEGSNSAEERFILAQVFRGFGLRSVGYIALDRGEAADPGGKDGLQTCGSIGKLRQTDRKGLEAKAIPTPCQ